jgi:antitoxin (DNA-binding transcriptional repressor) of toxin-antitoxin stability system
MTVTITELRRNLFQLVDRALEGESLQFTYKGRRIQIVPERTPSKLSKLTGQPVVARGELRRASRALFREMESEWEKDWAEL